jgi:hypothetical protein
MLVAKTPILSDNKCLFCSFGVLGACLHHHAGKMDVIDSSHNKFLSFQGIRVEQEEPFCWDGIAHGLIPLQW